MTSNTSPVGRILRKILPISVKRFLKARLQRIPVPERNAPDRQVESKGTHVLAQSTALAVPVKTLKRLLPARLKDGFPPESDFSAATVSSILDINSMPPAVSNSNQFKADSAVPIIGSLPSLYSPTWPPASLKAERKAYRNLAKQYGQTIMDATSLHDYGSLTPGRHDWSAKWANCKGKRILYFAVVDYSGSFYKWAEAVNRHTPHAVRMVSLFRHRYGYPLDILYMRGQLLLQRFPNVLNDLLTLADEADIIHLKDQDGFWRGRNMLPTTLFSQFRKPMVYTLYGGTSRKDETDPDYQRHVKSHSAIIAMTPDLCFDWCESVFIPHNVDADAHTFLWQDGKLIMHTPSTPSRKGTSMYRAAAEKVAAEYGLRSEVITGTSHDYIMRHKPLATLFFDQAGRESDDLGAKHIGWYGNSALEAAVYGVPTIAYLSAEAIKRANRAGYDVEKESAILNTAPSEEGLYSVMRDFFASSSEERKQLAQQTRKWIERHHSYQATAKKLSQLYGSL